MRFLFLLIALVCAGCSNPRAQMAPVVAPAAPRPVVWIRGDVKNPAVPWSEDLTLARAIVAADYRGLWDPRVITVIRQGESYRVNPRDLLSGRENPALEPGDTIVIER